MAKSDLQIVLNILVDDTISYCKCVRGELAPYEVFFLINRLVEVSGIFAEYVKELTLTPLSQSAMS